MFQACLPRPPPPADPCSRRQGRPCFPGEGPGSAPGLVPISRPLVIPGHSYRWSPERAAPHAGQPGPLPSAGSRAPSAPPSHGGQAMPSTSLSLNGPHAPRPLLPHLLRLSGRISGPTCLISEPRKLHLPVPTAPLCLLPPRACCPPPCLLPPCACCPAQLPLETPEEPKAAWKPNVVHPAATLSALLSQLPILPCPRLSWPPLAFPWTSPPQGHPPTPQHPSLGSSVSLCLPPPSISVLWAPSLSHGLSPSFSHPITVRLSLPESLPPPSGSPVPTSVHESPSIPSPLPDPLPPPGQVLTGRPRWGGGRGLRQARRGGRRVLELSGEDSERSLCSAGQGSTRGRSGLQSLIPGATSRRRRPSDTQGQGPGSGWGSAPRSV